jgi:hypothetical protein
VWRVGEKVPSEAFRTVVLRPGKPSDGFRPTGKAADRAVVADQADHIELRVEVMPGTEAGITVRRVAYAR